jgi:hypothetical protein
VGRPFKVEWRRSWRQSDYTRMLNNRPLDRSLWSRLNKRAFPL